MSTETREPAPPGDPSSATPGDHEATDVPESRWERWFGPLTASRLVVLLLAVAFLGGAAGYSYRTFETRGSDADIGFLRDMSVHHTQAVLMARLALGADMPPEINPYAEEIVMQQQLELGAMQATITRLGGEMGDDLPAMAWMGTPVPADEMPGMATPAELARLENSTGEEAASLFFAMMSRHHLGGVHMAEAIARDGRDGWTRSLGERMARNQRIEVREYAIARERYDLGVPSGYSAVPDLEIPPSQPADDGFPWVLAGVGAVALVAAVALWVVTRPNRDEPAGEQADEPTPAVGHPDAAGSAELVDGRMGSGVDTRAREP